MINFIGGPDPEAGTAVIAAGATGRLEFTFREGGRLDRMFAEETNGTGLEWLSVTDIVIGGDKVASGTEFPALAFAAEAQLSPVFGHVVAKGVPVEVSFKNNHAATDAHVCVAFGRLPADAPILRPGRSLVIAGGPAKTSIVDGASLSIDFKEPGILARVWMQRVGSTDLSTAYITEASLGGKLVASGYTPASALGHNAVRSPLMNVEINSQDELILDFNNDGAAFDAVIGVSTM